MQDPNEDTEWNDVLRAKGIIPPKKEKEVTEEEIIKLVEGAVLEKTNAGQSKPEDADSDGLDSDDERILEEYKAKRLQELKQDLKKSRFGTVTEISGQDYVQEVNRAGEGVWVVLHLYKQGIPLCTLVNQHISSLAMKFPKTKFLKSVSTVCIPNYPDKNLPTVFVYFEGNMKEQFIGPIALRGMNLTIEELEFMLGKAGAVESNIKKDPRKKIEDKMMSSLGVRNQDEDDDEEED